MKLQHVVSESEEHPQTTWIVKIVTDRHEYTVDNRKDQQIESRGVAESVARALCCPLVERYDTVGDVVIEASDLKLPFRERVKRYPALLGRPVPAPPNANISRIERANGIEFRWGAVTTNLVLGVLILGLLFFLLSAVPPRADQPSYLTWACRTGNYRLYYMCASVIALALLIVSGYRATIRLAPTDIRFIEKLWGVPLLRRKIGTQQVEEVRVQHTMRGPVVQIVSDRALLQFRTTDAVVAAWLGYEMRCFLACSDRNRTDQDPAEAERH